MNSIKNNNFYGIISRKELDNLLENNLEDDFSNIVLISIINPTYKKKNKMGEYIVEYNSNPLSNEKLNLFKDYIVTKFWDLEENISSYKIISNEEAKRIYDFIIKHKNNKFLIHCSVGQSRSRFSNRLYYK